MPPPSVTRQGRNGPANIRDPSAVLQRIKPATLFQSPLRMLVYGDSGTGKTRFWSTFPGKILSMVVSGSKRAGELQSIKPEQLAKINSVVIHSFDEVRFLVELAARSKDYVTYVLDHATGLQDMAMCSILGLEELPAQKSWGMATQQQWGQSTAMCKDVFRAMLDLPLNIVIIAQQREFKVEGAEDVIAPTIGAAMSPSLTGWLNPAVDYVVQTFKRPRLLHTPVTANGKPVKKSDGTPVTTTQRIPGVDFCLRIAPHDIYQTKFRSPRNDLPDVIVDPTYEKVLSIVRNFSGAPEKPAK